MSLLWINNHICFRPPVFQSAFQLAFYYIAPLPQTPNFTGGPELYDCSDFTLPDCFFFSYVGVIRSKRWNDCTGFWWAALRALPLKAPSLSSPSVILVGRIVQLGGRLFDSNSNNPLPFLTLTRVYGSYSQKHLMSVHHCLTRLLCVLLMGC